MPAIDVIDFRGRFPEFADAADAAVRRALDEARELSDKSTTCTMLAAAHLLALDADETSGGEVVRERVGPMEVEYAAQARHGGEAFWTRSKYGRRLLAHEARLPEVAVAARVYG